MAEKESSQKKLELTRSFIEAQLNRYASYHQSKEGMAYAGITLFGGIAGAASLSGKWPPPEWGNHSLLLSIIASVLLWYIFLTFLRFQLTRRRWAALRVAGCERLLAEWLQKPPSDEDLALAPIAPRDKPELKGKIINWLWGNKAAVQAVDTGQSVYPQALVKKWLDQEKIGTDALKHERMILICGWVLFFILLGSAVF